MENREIRRIADYLRDYEAPFDINAERDLLELWREGEGAAPSCEMEERLGRAIDRRNRRAKAGLFARCGAVAAMAALIFSAGFFLASRSTYEAVPAPPQKIVVVTAKGSVGKHTLPDGTEVWLNEASRLEYNSDFAENRSASLVGEGYFEVRRDTEHPFTLSMEHLQVEVLGTAFDARAYGGGAPEDVVLRRGKVKVDAHGESFSAILSPNERIVYNPSSRKIVRREVEAINYCRWMQDRMIFSNMPLADILTNLERKYNVRIKVSAELNAKQRLSLTVGHDSLEEVLAVVSALTSTTARYEDGGGILLTKRRR
ncbi:MAG: FecR domain-containing protein [Lachnospiraceae bacterium]|nr:FecR domain-containing protein [Lachnospiraceae bacterium]